MSAQFDALLVDIGNTRIKYAQCNRGETKRLDVSYVGTIAELKPLLNSVSEVIVASVSRQQLTDDLHAECQVAGVAFRQVTTSAAEFGIRCAYEKYQTLGVDRWLAVLGARQLTSKPVAIIDVGTAATCDIVVGEQHKGGWIAPGYSLMRDALIANTTHVFSDMVNPGVLELGVSTEACVNMGCLATLQGLYLNAVEVIKQFGNEYEVILCGGGSELLRSIANENTSFAEHLVLLGLARFID